MLSIVRPFGRKEAVKGSRWTEDRLMLTFESKLPAEEAAVAAAVLDWMKGTGH